MGVVVRASSRDTDEVDVQALQQTQEFLTLFQRYGNGILAIATEPVPVFSVDGFRRPEPILILSKRHEIKCAHANGQIEPGDFRTRPLLSRIGCDFRRSRRSLPGDRPPTEIRAPGSHDNA